MIFRVLTPMGISINTSKSKGLGVSRSTCFMLYKHTPWVWRWPCWQLLDLNWNVLESLLKKLEPSLSTDPPLHAIKQWLHLLPRKNYLPLCQYSWGGGDNSAICHIWIQQTLWVTGLPINVTSLILHTSISHIENIITVAVIDIMKRKLEVNKPSWSHCRNFNLLSDALHPPLKTEHPKRRINRSVPIAFHSFMAVKLYLYIKDTIHL